MLTLLVAGALSIYAPGDGHCGTELACGGRFHLLQHHVAIRGWRGRCGRLVRVCSEQTRRCAWSTIQDSGPWGAAKGGRWEVQIRLRPGWRRRAVVDLTPLVWRALGYPRFLSRVTVEVHRAATHPSS